MTREENIRAILECNFAGFKDEIIDNAVKRICEVEPSEWIPVSERLPEDGTWNIFTDGKKISIERYKTDALDHFYPSGRWFSLDEAVAWQLLPKPYNESEDKE